MPGDCQPLNQGTWVFMALKQQERRPRWSAGAVTRKLGPQRDSGKERTTGRPPPEGSFPWTSDPGFPRL